MSAEASGHYVVIAMPAYRAVKTLEKTVRAIPSGVADELILVDDASPDGTAELARNLGLEVYVHAINRGYGGNQKTCYTQALRHGANIVVMLHPDYQYEPEAVPLLIAPIVAGRADVTFGSRFAGLGDPRAGGMPLHRYLGNRFSTILENMMMGTRFTEMHSGMRAYTREALLSLPFLRYSDGFVFDSQLLVDAVTSGLRVVEVPIPTRYTRESSSIAIGPSLGYVWGSLSYCALRSRERGRRGKRSPVAKMRRQQRSLRSTGEGRGSHVGRFISHLETRGEENTPSWTALPRESFGYLVRGTRTTVLGDGDRAEERSSDVSIVPAGNGQPDAATLVRAAGALDDEGLLVVLLPPRTRRSAANRAAGILAPQLAEAGFRLVEVSGTERDGLGRSGRARLVARPPIA